MVKTGRKVKLSPHQIAFHLKHAEMDCPSFILVQYHPPATSREKPQLLLYRAEQAAELFARGIDVDPIDKWPVSSVSWGALRDRLDA